MENCKPPRLDGRTGNPRMKEKENNLREELAELEHEQWAHWTDYYLRLDWNMEDMKKWRKQVKTPYSELTEKEKDSDRKWADKVLEVFKEKIQNAQRRLKEEIGCGKDITIISSFKETWNLKCGEEFTDRTDKDRRKYYCDDCNRILKEIDKLA